MTTRASRRRPSNPSNGSHNGEKFAVDGSLIAANAGVLNALVAGGPRSVTLLNEADGRVTVEVLTAESMPEPGSTALGDSGGGS